MTSILFCKHGGFIYPVTSGQTMVQEDNYEAVFWYIDKDGNIVEVIWNISEEEFLDCNALSLEEIEKICNSKNPELVNRGFAKGIYNFCQKEGQDIECVNAAMYAKLKYTPWVDFPPQNSHPLEDWLNIYNSLEDYLLDE